MSEAVELLKEASRKLSILKEYRRQYSAKLAPDFNVLEYDPMGETRLSRLLADLLDPKGKHGQGEKFLELFLRDICQLPNYKEQAVSASVSTEVSTYHSNNSDRRMDIVIESTDLVVCIENKPWASDQPKQILDYLEDIRTYRKEWQILYLTKNGDPPSEESIPRRRWKNLVETEKRAQAVSFKKIRKWISSCIGQCQSERVRCYLTDLMSYLMKEFEGISDMAESDEIKKMALRNTEHLYAMLEINGVLPEIRQELILRLDRDLKAIFEEKGWNSIDGVKNTLVETGPYAGLTVETDRGYRISWEFEESNWNTAAYGLDRAQPKIAEEDGLKLKAYIDSTIAKGKINDYWLWFHFIQESGYKKWAESKEPWLGILEKSVSGHTKTAEFIVGKIEELNNKVVLFFQGTI